MTDRKRTGTIAAVIMAASVLMTACGSNTSAASGTGVAGFNASWEANCGKGV